MKEWDVSLITHTSSFIDTKYVTNFLIASWKNLRWTKDMNNNSTVSIICENLFLLWYSSIITEIPSFWYWWMSNWYEVASTLLGTDPALLLYQSGWTWCCYREHIKELSNVSELSEQRFIPQSLYITTRTGRGPLPNITTWTPALRGLHLGRYLLITTKGKWKAAAGYLQSSIFTR